MYTGCGSRLTYDPDILVGNQSKKRGGNTPADRAAVATWVSLICQAKRTRGKREIAEGKWRNDLAGVYVQVLTRSFVARECAQAWYSFHQD